MTETATIIAQLGSLSYIGIFVASAIANVIVPVPEEIILLAFGYLVGAGKLNLLIALPIIIAGMLSSDIIMYTLSKKGNRLLSIFYEKFFAKTVAKYEWLHSRTENIVFLSRFMIQLRFLGPFLAGQTGMSLKKFIKYDLAALLIYAPVMLLLGWYFQNKIELLTKNVERLEKIILFVVVALILFSIGKLVWKFLFCKNGKDC